MENFVVSARKYRPATFDTVVGQEHITTTLKNALKSNHLAQAFLFCGPRGVGKTTCARILAKTINCQNIGEDFEACGTCPSCTSFAKNSSLSVYELDAASNNSVEDIRNLVDQVRTPPHGGGRKVYIIDEVHMLSNSAFNAFLKTLEEPPSYVIFILATTEKHKIIPTILSRCQIFDFKRIEVEDMAQHLQKIADNEKIQADKDALELIAQKADGGLRDALSLFDMIATFSSEAKIEYETTLSNLHILDYDYYFKMTEAFRDENISQAFLIYDDILRQGFDGHDFVVGLAKHFRDLLVCRQEETLKLLEVPEKARQKYAQQAQELDLSFLLSALNLLNQCDLQYKSSKNTRLHVELCLMKICHIPAALDLSNALPEEDQSEKKKPKLDSESSSVSDSSSASPPKSAKASAKPEKKASPAPQMEDIPTDLSSLEDLVEQEEVKKDSSSVVPLNKESIMAFLEYFKKTKPGDITLQKILNRVPSIESEEQILLALEASLLEAFEAYREHFLRVLRKKFGNPNIQLRVEELLVEKNKRPYSNMEKFEYLAQKNPQVANLKDRLKLDVDH